MGDTTVENIIWGYEDPYPEMAHLKGYVGVYWDRVDAWYHGETRVDRPVEIAGRVNETNHFKACYPHLMAQWNSERNQRIGAYEFSAESNTEVWWKDAAGHEWRERIKDRVLRDIGGVEQRPLAAS
jgi:hypothetical protein